MASPRVNVNVPVFGVAISLSMRGAHRRTVVNPLRAGASCFNREGPLASHGQVREGLLRFARNLYRPVTTHVVFNSAKQNDLHSRRPCLHADLSFFLFNGVGRAARGIDHACEDSLCR
ncbi:hypothetical protein LMG29739_03596 [Paraburkholderia solisilvae]|uniref:Uncharacterized protein n=1 Tax=Paraburkholderia solisilvae TaxID=624376 RepID=A0A6J5E6V4_9BURK|nr:hypothetical protein LMG29739_03596 [Paraburkholderia solisilvae]